MATAASMNAEPNSFYEYQLIQSRRHNLIRPPY